MFSKNLYNRVLTTTCTIILRLYRVLVARLSRLRCDYGVYIEISELENIIYKWRSRRSRHAYGVLTTIRSVFVTRVLRLYYVLWDITTLITRVLRLYYVLGDVTTFALRPVRSRCVLSATQDRSRDLGVCFEPVQNKHRCSAIIGDHGDYSTMCGVSTTLLPRFYHAFATLIAMSTRSGPILSRRRVAVGSP